MMIVNGWVSFQQPQPLGDEAKGMHQISAHIIIIIIIIIIGFSALVFEAV